MKRNLTLLFMIAAVGIALLPVIVMLFSTVYVDAVVLRPGAGAVPAGFRAGTVREVRALSPRDVKLRLDEDHPLTVSLAQGAAQGFGVGDAVAFSPPPDILKHEPSSPVTLFHGAPKARSVLWARGVVVEITPFRAVLDAEQLTDLVVPRPALAGIPLDPGARIHFRPEKTLSLMNYRGLVEEIGPFAAAFWRWSTFRKAEFPRRLGLLFNTLVVALLTVFFAVVLGTAYAVCMVKFVMPGRGLFSWIYILPLLVPPYISAIAWTLVLGEQGTATKALKAALNLEKAPFDVYGIPGSVLVLSLSFFPIVTLLAQAGLRSVHREQEEAALLLGGRLRTLRRVTLPLAAPSILSGAVFVFIFALSSSGAPALLRLQLYSSQVMVAFQTDLSGGEAMATGTPLVLLAVAAVVFQGVLHGRKRFSSAGGVPLRLPLGLAGKIAAPLFCTILLVLAAGVPLAILLERAGSLSSFRTALQEMRADIGHSILVAAGAATAAVVVGGFLGALAARAPRGALLETLAIVPYAAPASVVGAGLLHIWDRPGLPGIVYVSGAILAVAGFTRFLPFAVLPAAAAVRTVPREYEEAAAVHGAGWFRRVARILLPLAARGFVAAWILVFVLSLSELDASILVAPAGVTTVPIRIFNAIHFGRTEVVSALCLILVFLAALPLLVYVLVTSRKLEVL